VTFDPLGDGSVQLPVRGPQPRLRRPVRGGRPTETDVNEHARSTGKVPAASATNAPTLAAGPIRAPPRADEGADRRRGASYGHLSPDRDPGLSGETSVDLDPQPPGTVHAAATLLEGTAMARPAIDVAAPIAGERTSARSFRHRVPARPARFLRRGHGSWRTRRRGAWKCRHQTARSHSRPWCPDGPAG